LPEQIQANIPAQRRHIRKSLSYANRDRKFASLRVKGQRLYQVDARRKGLNGSRKYFSIKAQAEARTATIEAEFLHNAKPAPAPRLRQGYRNSI